MPDFQIGFEVTEELNIGRGKDVIEEVAVASSDDRARAIGFENGRLGSDPTTYSVLTGNGKDKIVGDASATSDADRALAEGVRNEGTIELGNSKDAISGTATANTTQDGDLTFALGINSTGTGSIQGNNGKEEFLGFADASGQNDVGAFAILTTDLDGGRGDDLFAGEASASGISSTDARGVSVGFSDIDDDTTAGNLPGFAPTTSDFAETGKLLGGLGNDTVRGSADVTVAATDGDEIFFAGANGIAVDGGTIAQLEALLGPVVFGELIDIQNGVITDGATINEVEETIASILPQLETSTLDLGNGNDDLVASVTLDAAQDGVGADGDLEVIGDGIENAGSILLGDGADSVSSTVSVATTISGAKALADALDNSSVGIITGLLQEVNNQTLFDMGAGNDSFTSDIFASAVDDLAAADGLGNRGVFVAGAGDDIFNLEALSEFVATGVDPAEQQEGIADGWENRSRVFLDDQEGQFAGDDSIIASATTSGNGVLTIAEGIESREFFDAGGGNDSFDLTASATSEPVNGVAVNPGNLTQAAGLQTEQIDSGEFYFGAGNDTVTASGTATATGENRATLAFGITQVTGDATNAEDVGLFDAGEGSNVLDGTANASGIGNSQVDAHGILFTQAVAGAGDDQFEGTATATGGNLATGNGVRVGMLEDNPVAPDDGEPLPTEAGEFNAGAGSNAIAGTGIANITSDGDNVVFADANGILVDKDSILTTGDDVDTIEGTATAADDGVGGGSFATSNALSADGVEVRGNLFTGGGDDIINGDGIGRATNSFVIAEGIDFGLGSTQNGIPVTPIIETGAGNDQIIGVGESSAVGDEAASIAAGVQTQGDFDTGAGNDLIQGSSTSEVVGGAQGIRGTVSDGVENRDSIETADGDDTIDGTANAIADDFTAEANGLRNGISNGVSGDAEGSINTGAGNDSVAVSASATSVNGDAIANGIGQEGDSSINLGEGDDAIVAFAEAFTTEGTARATGISGGNIDTGAGDDTVEASSNVGPLTGGTGFGEGTTISLGPGDDVLAGFGTAAVDGGVGDEDNGGDRLKFEFTSDDFFSGGGSIQIMGSTQALFAFGSELLESDNFELFEFADRTFSFDELVVL